MAIRSALKGGTDLTDEAGKPSQWNDTFDAFYIKAYADNTGGSHSNSNTTETDLASVTVAAADFNSDSTSVSFLINATVEFDVNVAGIQPTFRLKVDGSTVKTIAPFTSVGNQSAESLGGFTYLATGIDLSSTDKIVKVTVQWSSTTGTQNADCNGLTVLAINNNS